VSEIIPAEKVAALLAHDDGGIYDEALDGWVTLQADQATVQVKVADHDDHGEEVVENAKHFRAVVVEGTETPLVLDRATFEKHVNERFDEAVRKLGCESLAFMPATIAALRQRILSLDVDLEASQAVQKGGAA
jgi:hypothetical protein